MRDIENVQKGKVKGETFVLFLNQKTDIMHFKKLVLGTLVVAAIACQKESQELTPANSSFNGDVKELQAAQGFAFNTVNVREAIITVRDLEDQPLKGVKVNFYTDNPEQGGQRISSAFTGVNGVAKSTVRVPAYLAEVFVQVNYPGFANTASLSTGANMVKDFGGRPASRGKGKAAGIQNITPIKGNYYYLGNFDSDGVPNYLEPTGDNLSADFLADVNASFPESKPVPNNNPQYLANGNQLDVKIVEKSDVWVTFVTEGAGNKNSLVYYVYDSNNPPATRAAIDSIFVVFPNTSFPGSGGNLQAGDKVKLGTFEAGKTISWGIISDGWTGSAVDVDEDTYFSTPALNTNESNPNLRQHSVQLVDHARQLLLNGFEDLPRSNGKSDEDFNDLMFYVTANPWRGIDTDNTPGVTITEDDDDDEVPNEEDEFPNDPNRGFTNNYTGTLAFEDLWPAEGDYDFNDLVVDYDITETINGSNEVVEISTEWTVRAVGASFRNGFGFQFANVLPNAVSDVTGTDLQESFITTASNGTEASQSKATVLAFDNVFNLINHPGTAFINTEKGGASAQPAVITVNITFTSPQSQADVGVAPYNAFLVVNKDRDVEVHRPDFAPTTLADQTLLGTGDDDSDPANGKYYKTANNLPWALHIEGSFDYPVEKAPITDAYTNFAAWAMSGGTQFADWYTDAAGNRNSADIY